MIFQSRRDNSNVKVVSESTQVQETLAKVVQDFGKIDVFIANAGMAISKPILEQTLEEYRKQMSVNGKQPFLPHKN